MRAEDLSKTLDHTVLAPDTDVAEIEAACDMAVQYHFAALCALPEFVPLIADRLRGTDVKTCAAEDSLESTAQTMTYGRFRHLPVVQDGKLTAIISIGDVVKHRIDQLTDERNHLLEYLHN